MPENSPETLLSQLTHEELKRMTPPELETLCQKLREVLIHTVSQTGGHLSSNLGVVELTVALHRCFDLPHDQIVWDVGHQCYVHKLLTGRADRFETIRKEGGLSGFPRPDESPCDAFIVGHSSTAVSAANGLAKAKALSGDDGYVVAVLGDGALTGGLAYEGLSNAGRSRDRLIVILNDNFASIAKSILYGRTIFKSIRKFIIFQLTMNLCAVGVSIIGPFIGIDTPVTVIQMLWINIIMDTLAGLAFAGEPPLEEYMEEPPKRRDEPVLNRYMFHQILCMGVFTILLCVLFLKLPLFKPLFRYANDPIYLMTAFFALFIFTGIFNSFNARTHRINLLAHLHKNPSFLLIMAMVAVIQLLLIYYGGSLFRTAGLTFAELRRVLLIAFLVVPADCVRKLTLRLAGRKGTL